MTVSLLFPKSRPALLDKRDRAASKASVDRAEREKCRKRSKGQCEMVELFYSKAITRRCTRRASENHHLIGGIGRKNVGPSILAEHRIETCSICHSEITGHVLQPSGCGREDAKTVRFERTR